MSFGRSIRPARAMALLAAALAFTAAAASAQDAITDIPEAFRDKALAVRVHTTVLRPDAEPWEDESVKFTIPGTPIGIRLVSSELIVYIQLTPYQGDTGRLMLVTQGQVWIKDASASVRYQTTLNTFPVALGEKIWFYPLGIEGKGPAPISVAITVAPALADSEAGGEDKAASGSDEAPAPEPKPAP
ncbi:MAG: hypothetical protein JXA15_03345 [Spirochaetales bacterium]|nr:hypothetical protein [Spirochaetales bacterium]